MQMDIEEHLYITAWIGVLDTKTGEIEYSNAGHIIAPLLYDGSELTALEVSGFPICRWIPTVNYKKKKVFISDKGRILLYTDGLSDAWRTQEVGKISQEFDSPDELAKECLKTKKFDDILSTIWERVSSDDTITNLSDDVAMLLIEYNQATEEEV
jgi:sigma-B regulation protein RsbU (phosphoserine phosphatase)